MPFVENPNYFDYQEVSTQHPVTIPIKFAGYKAMCDIDEAIACSSVFNSTYGRGFGIVGKLMGDENHPLNVPNSVYGIGFYRYYIRSVRTISSNPPPLQKYLYKNLNIFHKFSLVS